MLQLNMLGLMVILLIIITFNLSVYIYTFFHMLLVKNNFPYWDEEAQEMKTHNPCTNDFAECFWNVANLGRQLLLPI